MHGIQQTMESASREVIVPPDHFKVVTDDVTLAAELQSAIAICVYDAVEDAGALLHLRFIIRGPKPTDVTDTTLASELLLLDRCVESLREAAPAARHLQARIMAHLPDRPGAMQACSNVLSLVSMFLRDAGAKTGSPDIAVGAPRRVTFRPSAGWVHVR